MSGVDAATPIIQPTIPQLECPDHDYFPHPAKKPTLGDEGYETESGSSDPIEKHEMPMETEPGLMGDLMETEQSKGGKIKE